jgi:hypothetical protein
LTRMPARRRAFRQSRTQDRRHAVRQALQPSHPEAVQAWRDPTQ